MLKSEIYYKVPGKELDNFYEEINYRKFCEFNKQVGYCLSYIESAEPHTIVIQSMKSNNEATSGQYIIYDTVNSLIRVSNSIEFKEKVSTSSYKPCLCSNIVIINPDNSTSGSRFIPNTFIGIRSNYLDKGFYLYQEGESSRVSENICSIIDINFCPICGKNLSGLHQLYKSAITLGYEVTKTKKYSNN